MGVIETQDTKAMAIPCPITRMLLVARNGQPDETIH